MTALQIFNQPITQGPGAGNLTEHLVEIVVLLLVAFLLGFWIGRIMLSGYKRRNKELKADLDALRAEVQGQPDNNHEIETLNEKIRLLEDKNVQLRQEVSTNKSASGNLTLLESKLATQDQIMAKLKADLEACKKDKATFEAPPVAEVVAPVEEKPAASSAPSTPTGNQDDLKKIEGIGPKIEQLLNEGGIRSYVQLIDAGPDRIREILISAGPQYKVHDPSTWGTQARLAKDEKWEELLQMQTELKGGKKV